MKRTVLHMAAVAALFAIGAACAFAAQDKYTVKVPGGLAFADFRGYESWQVVSVSQDGGPSRTETMCSRSTGGGRREAPH